MTSIRVNPDSLMTLGSDINSLCEDYSKTLEKFKELMNEIDSTPLWDGIDEEKYMVKIVDKYLVNFDKIETELFDYADYLKKAGNSYAAVEEYLGNKGIDI